MLERGCIHACVAKGECKQAEGRGCNLRKLIQDYPEDQLAYILSVLDNYARGCEEIDELRLDIKRRLEYLNGFTPPEIFIG